jgi:hypothetical protein
MRTPHPSFASRNPPSPQGEGFLLVVGIYLSQKHPSIVLILQKNNRFPNRFVLFSHFSTFFVKPIAFFENMVYNVAHKT